ncbi:MAG: alpha/beta hydrolase [Burkholderiales bacterium]|jgi:pimeloyl-ACP methyl ester carboxylesterase|nr:MAG: alpha/beta hydrolase [Burkholderiales bacterium]
MSQAQQDTALFVHSTGMGPFMWKRLMATVPEGMRSLAVVNRGYAPDDLMPAGTPFTMDMDLAHIRQQIPSDTSGLHLVAHSYGGLLALLLTLDRDLPIKSLWLYEPVMFGSLRKVQDELDGELGVEMRTMYGEGSVFTKAEHGGTDEWLEAFINYWNGPGAWSLMPDKVKAPMRAFGWKMSQEVNLIGSLPRAFEDFRVDVPLTLVHGERTRLPALEMTRRLARVNSHALVETLPGLGHMSVVTDADRVAPNLQAHWQRITQAASTAVPQALRA